MGFKVGVLGWASEGSCVEERGEGCATKGHEVILLVIVRAGPGHTGGFWRGGNPAGTLPPSLTACWGGGGAVGASDCVKVNLI